jgi:hypothetical protein
LVEKVSGKGIWKCSLGLPEMMRTEGTFLGRQDHAARSTASIYVIALIGGYSFLGHERLWRDATVNGRQGWAPLGRVSLSKPAADPGWSQREWMGPGYSRKGFLMGGMSPGWRLAIRRIWASMGFWIRGSSGAYLRAFE